ncbi:MAG: hypothetical protein KIT09_23285 [Bryobacteraceae bacterium]|nr:hypothetical protein [Bryobacteraceae bacterium]
MKRLTLIPLLPLLAPLVPAQEQKAESPAPVQEQAASGTLDVGYRWVSDVGGNWSAYRSVVNLNDGFRVLGLDFQVRDSKKKLFDTLTLFANNWGDPYNVSRLEAERSGAYRLTFDYRNIAYYNFLPSFANPLLGQGNLISQRSFDMRRRLWNSELELRPGKRVIPYIGFSRDSGFGTGITPFVATANEYPVATDLDDQTNYYRGGVRLEFNRWHATLEQGGTTFKDDQRVFTNDRNLGNRGVPLLGQTLVLDRVNEAYGIRGRSVFSRGLLTAAPAKWVNLYGQFRFSQPRTDVRHSADAQGLFVLGATRFFNGQQILNSGGAKQPHTSGNFSVELRPHARVRVVESIMTDRLHNGSSLLLTEQFLFAAAPNETRTLFSADRLALNYNRQQADLFVDVTSRLTLRGGHRYEWGDSTFRPATLNPSGLPENGELKRNVGMFGFNYRATQRLSVNTDYEGASAGSTYFRTSLHNYHRFRARVRFQARTSLQVAANLHLLDNENPATGIEYDARNLAGTLSFQWNPANNKRVSLLGDYTYSSYRSDIMFLLPPFYTPAESRYRDNGHSITGLMEVNLPAAGAAVTPKISVGGSMFTSSGSRPTDYYQPFGRFLLPLHRNVACYAEWRWFGLSQAAYVFEGFRTHHTIVGLRLSL